MNWIPWLPIVEKVPRLGEFISPLSSSGQDEKGGWHLRGFPSLSDFSRGQAVSSLLSASVHSHLEVGVGEAPRAWTNNREGS